MMKTMDEFALTCWNSEEPAANAVVEEIDHFVARGMRRVYERGDYFIRHCSFNMDIWQDRQGRLLMRCWSRSDEVDERSFEIKGMDLQAIPRLDKMRGFEDWWIPGAVREAYVEWVREEL
jgi:hypothetical protein